jgi:anaerobic magnesium-protoporphyrin IX monomethyl ester cyclase
MRVALLNPRWRFDHSIYFGCRAPHLPIELACAKVHLEARGHEALMLDGHLLDLDADTLAREATGFRPDMIVVTTAPSYLFWRCAQPELTVPRDLLDRLRDIGAVMVAVGPHGSTTPGAALRKLDVDVVLRGECDEAVADLADAGGAPQGVAGAAWRDGAVRVNGGPRAARFIDLPALTWPDEWIAHHHHHHHRFDAAPEKPGAEVEASRGCPYACTFCAKLDFRDGYRRRALPALLEEIDRLIAQGVGYIYFIDEIFLPQHPLLEALRARPIEFGVQTRIDLWKPEMLDLLGAAGCVSIEAGVESLTPEGRAALDKKCRLETDELTALLVRARRTVPFVQANLIKSSGDDAERIAEWRQALKRQGIWANDPVPLFPYPASPDYRRLWGEPDDAAWERAHAHYLEQFDAFSDIQEIRPLPLPVLEAACGC